MKNSIELTRISNDTNGNPRYVVHFFALLNENDRKKADEMCKTNGDIFGVTTAYNVAIAKSRAIGGKKYHNKSFGGGIVFQSYNVDSLKKSILEVQNS